MHEDEETGGLSHFHCGGSSQVTFLTLYSEIIHEHILHRDRKRTDGFGFLNSEKFTSQQNDKHLISDKHNLNPSLREWRTSFKRSKAS